MNKNDMIIMGVETNKLFKNKSFEGFIQENEFDYESIILNNFEWLRRGNLEEDFTYKQPICYAMIVNPDTKKIFFYQRSGDEERLHGKWSCGIGGHIDKKESTEENPLYASMLREVSEEIYMNGDAKPRILGYINSEEDKVSQVHIGLLYLIETNSTEIRAKDAEISRDVFGSLSDLEKVCSNPDTVVEAWTKIALTPLRSYFNNL